MIGTDTMIKFGLQKLGEWIKSKGGTYDLTENEINDWLAQKGYAFSILCIDDEKKGKIIKIIYSGE